MRKLLAMLAVVLLAGPGVLKVGAAEVTVDLFYRSLEPHGEWIETNDYGYVWSPREVAEDWRPYTVGNWAYTDAGWTWVSEEPFGWATYHYGRWVRIEGARWVWVPGVEWAPAWVSWRRSPKYVGWAPLPPEARFRKTVGIKSWADSYYDIGPEYYSFVEVRQFGSPRLARVVVPPRENVTVIRETKNITNITVVNNYVFNGGPEYDVIVRESAEPVRRLHIERRMDVAFDQGSFREDALRTTVAGDALRIVAPDVRFVSNVRPARVARRIDHVQVDRGWKVANADQRQVEQLRTELRKEAPRPPAELPPEPKFERAKAEIAAGEQGRPGRAGQPADTERLSVPGTPANAQQSGATVGTPGGEERTRTATQPGAVPPVTTQPATTPGATTATPPADETAPSRNRDRARRPDRQQPGATPPAATPGAGATGTTPSATTPETTPTPGATTPEATGTGATTEKAADRAKQRGRQGREKTPAPGTATPSETTTPTPGTTPSTRPGATTPEATESGTTTEKEADRAKRRGREGREQAAPPGAKPSPTTPEAVPSAPEGRDASTSSSEKATERTKKGERPGRGATGPVGTTPSATSAADMPSPTSEQPRRGRGDRGSRGEESPSTVPPGVSERSPGAAGAGERPQSSTERRGSGEDNARTGRGDQPNRPERPSRPEQPQRPEASAPAAPARPERPERSERSERGGARSEAATPDRGATRGSERPEPRASAPGSGPAERGDRPERGGGRAEGGGERGGQGSRGAGPGSGGGRGGGTGGAGGPEAEGGQRR